MEEIENLLNWGQHAERHEGVRRPGVLRNMASGAELPP